MGTTTLPTTITPTGPQNGPSHSTIHNLLHKFANQKFNVTDSQYGATGDGSTDEVTAIQGAINDAISAALAAGDGVKREVHLPAGRYRLTSTTTSAGITHHLYIDGDYVRFTGPGVLYSTVSAYMFLITGGAKPAGVSTWTSYRYAKSGGTGTSATLYDLSGSYSQGDTSLTLATASEAGNFTAGDYIFIRTGQVLSTSAEGEPDSEINQVLSADAGTGVITLKWPLAKAYAQEYYISGTTGLTSTSVTANLAPYGVENVTDRTLHDIEFDGVGFYSEDTTHSVLAGDQIVGLRIRNCYVTCKSYFQSMSALKDAWCHDNRVHLAGTGTFRYMFSVAFGSSDAHIYDNVISSERVAYMHIHEGSSRINVHDNQIVSTPTASDEPVIDIRARAYDINVHHNTIVGGGNTSAIYVDQYCNGGGYVGENIVKGTNFAKAITIGATGWTLGVNRTPDAYVGLSSVTQGNQAGRSPAYFMSAWAADNAQNPTIGPVPSRSLVTIDFVDVTEAFNSDGTDTITVGWDSDPDALLTSLDVSTTGRKDISSNFGVSYGRYLATGQTVEIYYSNGGSEPSTGKVIAGIRYVLAEEQVA